MSKQDDKVKSLARRRFLTDTAQAACATGLLGLGLTYVAEKSKAHDALALRPPGALPEEEFLASCLRCGLCVRDCPWDTLKLATPEDLIASGTPYFTAREIPCELCEDIPCVLACPSGALDPALTDINDSRMGLAALVDRTNCLSLQGLRCEVCYRICPLIDEAITLKRTRNERTGVHTAFEPVINPDVCTGCGKCEEACVLEEAAIKIFPRDLALGQLGEHYRLGWEEAAKAGKSFTPDILDLPDRLPEGVTL
ncbi:ferredoxin-type protein NapG [Parendozoicomonas haliclonae]|uniref:Quinol dehydrogenase periplasmic component n=1 Tax=Parendozoicomonas haliclonae TaxID=1960125 RepID=A0A1X7AFA7_9GAMM|nr:ferredoxin-type protein NapG [Parendozoicomonas haliclonae]SMA35105.1 quinol dehydrogenase periplasmic component [Parendozoicomonas haliclonae]